MTSVRIALPSTLSTLAGVGHEVTVDVPDPPTIRGALDALEAAHPALRGTIRDRATGARRPFIRYFVCGRDVSHESDDDTLPGEVASMREALRVIGAISGG